LISAAMLEKESGDLRVSAAEAAPSTVGTLEAVFGADRFESLQSLRRGLERAACVARIGRTVDAGVGTGFVISGRLLCDRLDDRPVLVTANHVVSESEAAREYGALHPSEAMVTFAALEGVSPDTAFGVAKTWWASPPEELDVIVLELSEPVPLRVPY